MKSSIKRRLYPFRYRGYGDNLVTDKDNYFYDRKCLICGKQAQCCNIYPKFEYLEIKYKLSSEDTLDLCGKCYNREYYRELVIDGLLNNAR